MIERRYLSCKRGHSTFYKDIDQMPPTCPVCNSGGWPTLVPVVREQAIGLIVLGFSLASAIIAWLVSG